MQDINFLRAQASTLTKQAEKDRRLFKYVLIAFTGVMVVFSLTLGAKFFLQLRLKSLKEQVSDTKNTITGQETIEAQYLFFVNKLNIIRQLFEMRSDKQAAISYFTNLFGPEIEISGINYEMKEGILSLIITSPDVFKLEEVFKRLEDPAIETNFQNMSKSGLRRNKEGSYSFNITVTFKEEFKEQLEKDQEAG